MNWKFWSPMHTKEQREIVEHMTEEEKREFLNLSKETGKKIGQSFLPTFIIFGIIAFVSDSFPPDFKYCTILIVTIFINFIVTRKLVVLPQNESALNFIYQSKYARENGLSRK